MCVLGLARTIYKRCIHGILGWEIAIIRSYTVYIQGWPEPYIYSYIRCTYGIFGRETTIHTVIYGANIRFCPTLFLHIMANPSTPDAHKSEKGTGRTRRELLRRNKVARQLFKSSSAAECQDRVLSCTVVTS
jgi:hypothetical protein